ncbi:ATP-binding protein [Allostreptomyces psammosilenae]|uniref:Anti-sigma regulatory factor (Ser/Thr protein kinase) n=1 Tax=Allostreptomyces psammosilenae TaxID=1892865 RepID=A0A853A0R5_9ACTN|nr:ATP-binding protein [Allostreptomyces psammosilenae]NYI06524.1 anti-sigma regulatory factor (Ser/Thr protein kinase) [Allostreptomyces psammosilenae]
MAPGGHPARSLPDAGSPEPPPRERLRRDGPPSIQVGAATAVPPAPSTARAARQRLEEPPAALAVPPGTGPFSYDALEELRLSSTDQPAATARRVVRAVLALWDLEALNDTATRLVTELVVNSVRHTGGGSVGLRLERRPGRVRVEVRDPSKALPCLIDAGPEPQAVRGLRMVDQLAYRWGADLLPRGKAVWFELRLPARRTR